MGGPPLSYLYVLRHAVATGSVTPDEAMVELAAAGVDPAPHAAAMRDEAVGGPLAIYATAPGGPLSRKKM